MSEEIKITVPILDEEEKRRLENMTLNEMQPAIDEFTKRNIKDKNLAVAQIVIKKQQQEINNIKNKLLDILEGKKLIENETPEYIKENYIAIQKIKDKMEELEKFIYSGRNAPQDFLQYRIKAKIQGYKELLELE